MNKFTPGPWQSMRYVNAPFTYMPHVAIGTAVKHVAEVRLVKVGYSGNAADAEESEANAILIAAAPKLLGALVGMVTQHCTMADDLLDSCALSANAEAMEVLEGLGLIEITDAFGRRAIGKWKAEP